MDLAGYLARIGYDGSLVPSAPTLRALHRAHVLSVPFEAIDAYLGRPIRIDLSSIEAKLVGSRRGGYCFEQNALFAAALEEIGFPVTRLAGRVRLGSTEVRARTHMLLAVEAGDTEWLADVGFGAAGLLEPVPLAPGASADQEGWRFRVVAEDATRVLRSSFRGEWKDLYAFTLEPAHPADYEVGNWFTSTHPESMFVAEVVAQRITLEHRLMILGRDLAEFRPDDMVVTPIGDADALVATLAERFTVELPEGTHFPAWE